MNCHRKTATRALALALTLGLCPVTPAAWATSMLFDLQDSCATTNCSAARVKGTYVRETNGNSVPWVGQFHSYGSNCVRLEVLSQSTNLEMVLISPGGAIWNNDDSGVACFNCPLIKANTTSSGWYTVQISPYNGEGFTSDFELSYGQYNSGNANCSSPTLPLEGTTDEGK